MHTKSWTVLTTTMYTIHRNASSMLIAISILFWLACSTWSARSRLAMPISIINVTFSSRYGCGEARLTAGRYPSVNRTPKGCKRISGNRVRTNSCVRARNGSGTSCRWMRLVQKGCRMGGSGCNIHRRCIVWRVRGLPRAWHLAKFGDADGVDREAFCT